MPKGPTPNPQPGPPQQPPADLPQHDDRGVPKKAPGAPDEPDVIELPPAREPGPPPTTNEDSDRDAAREAAGATDSGATDVTADEAHVGATEEQVSDRTGPGAGYDEEAR